MQNEDQKNKPEEDLAKRIALEIKRKTVVEEHVVNGKVFIFCICLFMCVTACMCFIFMFMYFSSSSNFLEEKNKNLELNEQLYDTRRALDQTSGRLAVYEDFLVGMQSAGLKRLVNEFMRVEQRSKAECNLDEFESWVDQRTPSAKQSLLEKGFKAGMGGR